MGTASGRALVAARPQWRPLLSQLLYIALIKHLQTAATAVCLDAFLYPLAACSALLSVLLVSQFGTAPAQPASRASGRLLNSTVCIGMHRAPLELYVFFLSVTARSATDIA
jgi:hypothetical protein